MNRRELTTQIGDKLHLPAATVGRVLDTALALLLDDLIASGSLQWRGLGTFAVRTYAARRIHDPRTGRIVNLPVRRSVTFKPSSQLRARLTAKAKHRGRAPAPR
jgi:nucleoid DNA-binding protein